jgi:hypothetical protein
VVALAVAPGWAGTANGPNWLNVRAAAAPPARDGHAMAYDSRRGRVVLFAGANEYDFVDFADTWEWDGTSWIQRTPITSPPRRFAHAMAYDAARGRVVLFGGFDFFSGIALSDTWEWDGNTWIETTPATAPPARSRHAMAYDAVRQRVLLFGGVGDEGPVGDTWEWDGSTWIEHTPAASPSPREYGALAYDGVRGRVVLFGGFDGVTYFADTWEWDGDEWIERATATQPPGRTWQMLTFDEGRARTVLFGGYDGSTALGDTWEWDGNAWLNTTPGAGPSRRVVAAMVFDRARSRAVMFGGFDGRSPLGDTWEWDGNSWVESTTTTSPPARSNHAAAYDDARRKTVIFGGYAGGAFFADTWEWDGSVWARSTPASSPPSRVFHSMAYDRARGRVVLFGGFGQRGAVADTWEWDGSHWVQMTPTTSPPARHSHSMVYDAARGRVVLFGGSDGLQLLGDTWEWDGSNWFEVTPETGPAPRFRHAMVYDAVRARTVLFGGCSTLACPSNDTWEWDGSSWVERAPATRPRVRLEHTLAYDVGRNRTVLFGGSDGRMLLGDTWEWDGNDWTESTAASSPTARFHHTMTYDGVSGSVLLFGGNDGRTYLADTWEYGPIAACAHANRVIAFAPGDGSASASALAALGAPDGSTVALGIGGRVDLGLESAALDDAGTDLIVHATTAASFSVEAGEDGDHYTLLRECPGGECQIDLSEAGLAGISYLRITSLSQETGAEIDAVSVVHAGSLAIACPASVRVECQIAGRAVVSLPAATVVGSCSGNASIVNDHNAGGADASGDYPLGTTMVTFTATDGAGNVASCSTSITVADTTPPVMTVRATPDVLWPPNHTMLPVHFDVVAVDACDPTPVTLLQSLASSDPDDAPGRGDGATIGDIQGAAAGTDDFDVLLRAERDDRGPGRTYTARYQSTDGSGNVATGVGIVAVPHDLRRRHSARRGAREEPR